MPLTKEQRSRYPTAWKSIRATIRERAGDCCEVCGLRNYCVGYRDASGAFHRDCGNGPCDAAGDGLAWPSLNPITCAEAREFAEAHNDHNGGRCDAEGNHWFVIVLTVGHLNHDPADNRPENLKLLCQLHHLRYDQRLHAENARRTRERKTGQQSLFSEVQT